MSRWNHEYDEIQYNEMRAVGYASSTDDAQAIIDAHNADCDAYEARIAELTAELARVKAESMRVVADGGPVTVFRLDGNDKFILHNGETYYRSGEAFICTNNRIVGRIEDDTIVQPVRLE